MPNIKKIHKVGLNVIFLAVILTIGIITTAVGFYSHITIVLYTGISITAIGSFSGILEFIILGKYY